MGPLVARLALALGCVCGAMAASEAGVDAEILALGEVVRSTERVLLEKRSARAAAALGEGAEDARHDRALQEEVCGVDNRDWRGPGGETCYQLEDCSVSDAAVNCLATCCEPAGSGEHGSPVKPGESNPRDQTDGHADPGGHTEGHSHVDLFRTAACDPVLCGPDVAYQHVLQHEDPDFDWRAEKGCAPHSIHNHINGANETIYLKCRECVPRICADGEHNCVPVYCGPADETDEELEFLTDPCQGGHHDDDGLAWWPFLLACLVVTVVVTAALHKLSNGACCGKSINPPFTVVMFFFGYYISHLCVQETSATGEDAHGHAGDPSHHGVLAILFKSVLAWKAAHPHVILFVLLPPLLFEDASSMDYYVFRKVLLSSVILAGPGVLISMLLTAGTTMLLFGFAEECVVEKDTVSGALMVGGARENTIIDGRKVCEPQENLDWQSQQGPDGGLICMECVEGSWSSPQLPVSVHLLLGGMLAATDPVAVCAVLNDLGCPAKLNYMIAGESLLNDGTAVVAFMVMQGVAGGCDTTAFEVVITLLRLAGGGVLWGLFVAAACYESIKHISNPNIEITTLLVGTLSTFWLAENVLGVSGVLGTVVFGVQTARTSFLAMDERTHHANHAFWGEVGYVATSFIFILAGVKSRDKIASFIENFEDDFADDKDAVCEALEDEMECLTHHVCRWDGPEVGGTCQVNDTESADAAFYVGNQVFLNLILWVVLGFIRAGVVALFSPVLTKIGYGLTVKEAIVLVWGGLRGAVSLSLALLIDGNHLIGDRARETIFLQTTGIVTLTLVINGTTAGKVYKMLQVYRPNPFRPALATQSLRTIQAEMDRYVHKLGMHWFHSNVDMDALTRVMPSLAQARMEDGDLVNVEMLPMSVVWSQTMQNPLAPVTLPPLIPNPDIGADGDEVLSARSSVSAVATTVVIEELCGTAQPGLGASRASIAAETAAPNPYGHVVLVAGETVQSFETPVLNQTYTPTWAAGTASHEFGLASTSKDLSATLKVSLYDSDFGEDDKQIGYCSIDLSALCVAGGEISDTYDLMEESGTPQPSPRCIGTVDLEVSCFHGDDGGASGVIKVDLRNAVLFRADAASPGPEPSSPAGHGNDHSHSHDHGHGHGPSHVDKLRSIRRWLNVSEAVASIDHSFAMYDIVLASMRSNFLHECEKKSISVKAYSELSAMVGMAIDLNDVQLDNALVHEVRGSEGNLRASRLSKMVAAGKRESPIDALESFMMDYADKTLKGSEADSFFTHRLLCTEMFFVLIEQLEQFAEGGADADSNSDIAGFSANAIQCCNRCKRKLAEMQVAAPNTMRICHTIVAFNVVAAEFSHRVAAYLDNGFFAEDMADSAIHIVLGRQRQLKRFFSFNPIVSVMLVPFRRSSVVFQAHAADSKAPRPAATAVNDDQARNGTHSNGKPTGAGKPVTVETANPIAVDSVRERRQQAQQQQPPPPQQQQAANSAVQMLRERRLQPQPQEDVVVVDT